MAEEAENNVEETNENEEIASLDDIEETILEEEQSANTDNDAEETESDETDEEAEDNEDAEDDTDEQEELPEPEKNKDVDKSFLDYENEDAYIMDKLPTIKVYGQDGEDGDVKEFEIKTATELPDDFIPRSYKDAQVLSEQLADQRKQAEKLLEEYRYGSLEARNDEFRAELEASWEVEIDELTKAGELPTIKVKQDDPNYFEDPGVKAVADVIEFMGQMNDELNKKNAPYRVQSFAQAKTLLDAQKLKEGDKAEIKQEAELRKVKGGMVSSSSSNSAPRQSNASPYYTRGDDLEDVASKVLDDLMS